MLVFFLCNFTSHGICINFGNQQIYYLINLYVFVACLRKSKSVVTCDIKGLCKTFKIIKTLYCSVTYLVVVYNSSNESIVITIIVSIII